MHRDASRRSDDARDASVSAATSLHGIDAADDVPGHRCRAAPRQAKGTATPHAAAQAKAVHAFRGMLHLM